MGIDWTRVIELVFGYFGGVTGLVGVSLYLGKTALPHWLNKETERYKVELRVQGDLAVDRVRAETKAEQDRSLEVLRAEIRVVTAEHELRYARLVERRATVIAELYKHLTNAEVEFQYLMSPYQSFVMKPEEDHNVAVRRAERERREVAGKAGDAFNEYFRHHRIFFSPETCAVVDEFKAKQWAAWHDFSTFDGAPDNLSPENSKARDSAREKAWLAVRGELPRVRERLEGDFRELLGVGVRAAPSAVLVVKGTE